jgi:hypothetical protein
MSNFPNVESRFGRALAALNESQHLPDDTEWIGIPSSDHARRAAVMLTEYAERGDRDQVLEPAILTALYGSGGCRRGALSKTVA